jgi:hypothetical protein
MKHPTMRKGMIALALLVLALSICIYAYVYTEAASLSDKAVAERDSLHNAELARLSGAETLSLLDSTAAPRAGLGTLFIPAEDAVQAIKTIESIGDASGASVAISSISAADPDADTHVGKVAASVSIRGTWKQATQAIALFETLPYGRNIRELSLRSLGGEGKEWQAEFSISILTLAHN